MSVADLSLARLHLVTKDVHTKRACQMQAPSQEFQSGLSAIDPLGHALTGNVDTQA